MPLQEERQSRNPPASAAGTASQTPSSPIIRGRSSKHRTIRHSVRTKEITADTLPLDKAVNRADEKMLTPENK